MSEKEVGSGITKMKVLELEGVLSPNKKPQDELPEMSIEQYFDQLYAHPRAMLKKNENQQSLEYETPKWYAERMIGLVDQLALELKNGNTKSVIGVSIMLGEYRREAEMKFKWERRILWQQRGLEKGQRALQDEASERHAEIRKKYEHNLSRAHNISDCCRKSGLDRKQVYRAYKEISRTPPQPD